MKKEGKKERDYNPPPIQFAGDYQESCTQKCQYAD
jgi:hypothetical protein